jgi:hypothetical protein
MPVEPLPNVGIFPRIRRRGELNRWPEARNKHRAKGNWLKMYDEQDVMFPGDTVSDAAGEAVP